LADELQQLTEQLAKLQQQCWELTLSAINTPTPDTASAADDNDHSIQDPLKQLLQDAHLQFLNNIDKQGAKSATDKLSQHFETAVNPALQTLFLKQWQIPPESFRTADKSNNAGDRKPSTPFESLLADSNTLTALGTRFNTALAKYLEHFEFISRDTLKRFEQHGNCAGETADLFNAESLWTECYEASYQQQVFTPEYQRDYGELCNCASELKLHLRRLAEPHLAELGLVSLDDFRQSLQRQQQQKKTIRRLKQQLKSVGDNIDQMSNHYDQRLLQMEQDNAELKAELQQLRHLLMSRGTQ